MYRERRLPSAPVRLHVTTHCTGPGEHVSYAVQWSGWMISVNEVEVSKAVRIACVGRVHTFTKAAGKLHCGVYILFKHFNLGKLGRIELRSVTRHTLEAPNKKRRLWTEIFTSLERRHVCERNINLPTRGDLRFNGSIATLWVGPSSLPLVEIMSHRFKLRCTTYEPKRFDSHTT